MKIRVKRQFKYMQDGKEHTLEAGEYQVPRQVEKSVAETAIEFSAAVIVPEKSKKKAPENKAVKAKETK